MDNQCNRVGLTLQTGDVDPMLFHCCWPAVKQHQLNVRFDGSVLRVLEYIRRDKHDSMETAIFSNWRQCDTQKSVMI